MANDFATNRRLIKLAQDMRPAKGMPSYMELVTALCDALDGTQDHHIVDLTGNEDDANKIAKVREAVKPLWLQTINQN